MLMQLLLQSTTIKAVASGVATQVLANDGFPAEQVAAVTAAGQYPGAV